jgi:hypothetical protein
MVMQCVLPPAGLKEALTELAAAQLEQAYRCAVVILSNAQYVAGMFMQCVRAAPRGSEGGTD